MARDGGVCRGGEDLEAQSGHGYAQYGQQGPTESEEGPGQAGQASKTRDEQVLTGQALIMVCTKVFRSFVMFLVCKVSWFELMRGGVGMPKIEIYGKQRAKSERLSHGRDLI